MEDVGNHLHQGTCFGMAIPWKCRIPARKDRRSLPITARFTIRALAVLLVPSTVVVMAQGLFGEPVPGVLVICNARAPGSKEERAPGETHGLTFPDHYVDKNVILIT